MKKTLSILCIILVMFYAMVSSVFANNTPIAVDTAQDAIENFVAAMDEQDWNTYLQLLPEDQKDDMEYFLLDNNNITEHLGVLNIVSAQIDSINEIPAISWLASYSMFIPILFSHMMACHTFMLPLLWRMIRGRSRQFLEQLNLRLRVSLTIQLVKLHTQ